MSDLGPFHQELFSFLAQSAKRRTEEEGFDIERDPQLQSFHRSIEQGAPSSLDEIVGDYQYIFNERGPLHVEYRWMSSFSEKEFADLGLSHYFPKIYRGLPRLYHRNDPSRCRIKKNFTNLADLKRLAVDRAVFSLYEGKMGTVPAKIGIVTHVLSDGLGDWIAATETALILAAKWPFLEIHLFVSSARELPIQHCPFTVHLFAKEEFPKRLYEMDCLLQIPTRLSEDIPKAIKIGEYGFLESEWFHPKSGHWSMGLHVLEKGVFLRKVKRTTFGDIEQKALLFTLFGTETPGPSEIETYQQKNRFHLAYLATPRGGAIYLHSLLKMCERDQKDIDLCCPDLHWLIEWLQEEKEIRAHLVHIKEILVVLKDGVHRIPVAESGKTIRIISLGPLSAADMRRVLFLSDDWVAVRGNQSLSEAISANKAFFYDGRSHARYLMKDLSALAENRLRNHRGALHAFRMMGQAFLWNLPEEESLWVEEVFFQQEEKLPWMHIATELGISLQDGDTIAGFKKICKIISEEHSFNSFLCHLIERELFHQAHPFVREAEEQLVRLYSTGHISFSALVKNLRVRIYTNKL